MTKEELKEAIAATITENGQKGITATALANLLNEIVDAAGSGGGTGGGTVLVNTQVTEPNEENASAYATLVNGFNNGVLYHVVAQYIIPITVYAYVFNEETEGIAMILDLSPLIGELHTENYMLKPDGSIEKIELE